MKILEVDIEGRISCLGQFGLVAYVGSMIIAYQGIIPDNEYGQRREQISRNFIYLSLTTVTIIYIYIFFF